jgi:hypothetical protein
MLTTRTDYWEISFSITLHACMHGSLLYNRGLYLYNGQPQQRGLSGVDTNQACLS